MNLDVAVNGDKNPGDFVNSVMRNIRRYAQARINGRPIVGTFLGHDKTYGEASVNDGWQRKFKDPLRNHGIDVFFIPYFPLDARTIYERHPVADGFQMWDSTWPNGNFDVSYVEDRIYAEHKGSRVLVSGVSPCFFKHLNNGVNDNRIFRPENNWHKRWHDIINEQKADMIQVLTWNDFGESHYVGPVNPLAAFPSGPHGSSREYVDRMSHEAFFETLPFYIQWFKTGSRPAIQQNMVALYHRRHSKWLPKVTSDGLDRPANADFTRDVFMIESFVKDGERLEFEVLVGGTLAGRADVGQGAGYREIPFNDQPGPVELIIRQSGQERTRIRGTYIESFGSVAKWNFNLFSRFVRF